MRPALLLLALLVAAPGTVRAACQVDANPVAFGTVRLGGEASGTGRLVLDCDKATQAQIGILAADGTRYMRGPNGARLAYQLFQDAGHRTRWGSGRADGAMRQAAAGGRGSTTVTVYGVIPKQTGLPPGTYVDQLTISVEF